jgi:hypothetical protein
MQSVMLWGWERGCFHLIIRHYSTRIVINSDSIMCISSAKTRPGSPPVVTSHPSQPFSSIIFF